ncbi:MAG: YqeG family HAD IIIA-type phosphatase [Clostridia bacterium]|nr:YqeG family HAD IIIA-type phosphatase [Clostridia bacterium]
MSKNPFRPDETKNTVYDIDYDELYLKGIDCLIFDLDNTLLPQDDMDVPVKVKSLFEALFAKGFDTMLVSNNGEGRIKPVADILDTDYIAKAAKPLPGGVIRAMKTLETKPRNTVLVGDQLSDVMAGNLAELHTIWVKPISVNEHLGTKIKRGFERVVIRLLNIRWD